MYKCISRNGYSQRRCHAERHVLPVPPAQQTGTPYREAEAPEKAAAFAGAMCYTKFLIKR